MAPLHHDLQRVFHGCCAPCLEHRSEADWALLFAQVSKHCGRQVDGFAALRCRMSWFQNFPPNPCSLDETGISPRILSLERWRDVLNSAPQISFRREAYWIQILVVFLFEVYHLVLRTFP